MKKKTMDKLADELKKIPNAVPQPKEKKPLTPYEKRKQLKVGDVLPIVATDIYGVEVQPDMFVQDEVTFVNVDNTMIVHGKGKETVPGSNRYRLSEWDAKGSIPGKEN